MTIGEFLFRSLAKGFARFCEFLWDYKSSAVLAMTGSLAYSLLYGFRNPHHVKRGYYNFVQPGADVTWDMTRYVWGALWSGIDQWLGNIHWVAGLMVIAVLIHWAVVKLLTYKLPSHHEKQR
jgi:hypothetical protein